MSKYTNYEKVSQTYDTIRYASGVETIVSIVGGLVRKQPEEIVLLDAGCGTGNYSHGFLENGIGSITMIDGSKGMLEKAKEKTAHFGTKVKEIKQHFLPSLPYPDNCFDVVSLLEVAHHLDTYHLEDDVISRDKTSDNRDVRAKYPNLSVVLSEAFRVLKSHGVLVIDTSFSSNIDASWISLAPKATAIFKQAFIPESELIPMLRKQGYRNVFYVQRPGCNITKQGLYDNPERPLDPNFRANSSEWTFVERSGELPELIAMLEKKKNDGTLAEFVGQHSKLHAVVGETTLLFAQKIPLTIGTQL